MNRNMAWHRAGAQVVEFHSELDRFLHLSSSNPLTGGLRTIHFFITNKVCLLFRELRDLQLPGGAAEGCVMREGHAALETSRFCLGCHGHGRDGPVPGPEVPQGTGHLCSLPATLGGCFNRLQTGFGAEVSGRGQFSFMRGLEATTG